MRIAKEIANALGCYYMYDTMERINLRADILPVESTLIGELLPTSGTIDTTFAPLVREQRNTTFVFMRHCELDFKGKDVGDIIDDMVGIAKRFIVKLDASGLFEPIANVKEWSPIINRLDANMAGVALTLELKDAAGECVNG